LVGIAVILAALGIASAEITSRTGDVINVLDVVLGPLQIQLGDINGGGSAPALNDLMLKQHSQNTTRCSDDYSSLSRLWHVYWMPQSKTGYIK
jgi:hypothetical protein